jgi:GR25 family glycosyltransferase involved in LPS biosynthesis
MHILNKEFDKVVCINLIERKDKKEKIQKRFDELGIKVEWFHPVKFGFADKIVKSINDNKIGKFNYNQPNEIGAALSHYSVIKSALIEGIEKLFVFEDDILFHENFNEKLETAFKKLPSNWDFISLYSFMYNISPQNIKINPYWMKMYKSWSLTSYGMNKKYMDIYIKKQDNFLEIADMVTYKLQENTNLKQYVTAPTLVIPDVDIHSDIRKFMNYKSKMTILNLGIKNNYY